MSVREKVDEVSEADVEGERGDGEGNGGVEWGRGRRVERWGEKGGEVEGSMDERGEVKGGRVRGGGGS